MIKVQMLSVATLKSKSVLQQNIDEKILNIAIREFQDIELTRTLGRTEYLRLEAAISASIAPEPTPLTNADAILFYDYIEPYLIYGSLMYAIPAIHRKLTNAGAKVDAYQNSVSDDLAAARADYAFKADNYKRNLLEYRAESSVTATCCKTVEDTTFNFTGIALPDNPRDNATAYENRYYKTGGSGFLLL